MPVYGTAFGVLNGKLYVAGGQASATDGDNQALLQVYDPATNSWSAKAPMPFASGNTQGGVIGGKLYVAGGQDSTNTASLNTLRVYDPATDQWTLLAPMSVPRSGAGCAVINGILYVAGGNNAGTQVNVLEAYDPVTDTWSTKAPAPTMRSQLNAGVVNGLLYIVGGTDGVNDLATVEAYDPIADSWTIAASMSTARVLPGVGVVNGILYAIGGFSSPTTTNLASVEAFTLSGGDSSAPTLSLPSNITANATGPAGAVVTYTASATDNTDPNPTVLCSPSSGSSFPLGTTTVHCTATDASHNSSQGSFTVTVNGASNQTANLITLVQSFNLAQGITNGLDAKLQNVLDAFNAANAGNRANACNQLTALVNSVMAQSGKQLTVAQATQLIAKANQIKAAQGCP